MPSTVRPIRIVLALILFVVVTGSPGFGGSRGEAPPAPSMPKGWAVTKDVTFDAAEVNRIARNLGARLEALRNTDYLVNGKQVRINTLVAPDEANAKAIAATLAEIKPAEFSLRKGTIVYELVGKNAAIPEMRAAIEHLRKAQAETH